MLDESGRPIELGRGAMGITYKALDVDLRCPVTLKVISERYLGDESARLRFLREARATASVRHSNVASVLHLGRTGNSYFDAMEFVEGETLEHFIRRSGGVEVKVALEIVAQVAAGLAAVYEQSNRDFNTRGLCRDTGVCQSRAVRRSPGRHPLGSVSTWYHALGDGDRQNAIPGHSW
jgi:serine/threonine protein kinase